MRRFQTWLIRPQGRGPREKCGKTGRQVAISSSPEPRVSFNLVDFNHNESRLLGVDSLKLSFEETAEILRRLTPGIEAGTFPPPAVENFPLEEAPRLYQDIAESRIKTKPILVP